MAKGGHINCMYTLKFSQSVNNGTCMYKYSIRTVLLFIYGDFVFLPLSLFFSSLPPDAAPPGFKVEVKASSVLVRVQPAE